MTSEKRLASGKLNGSSKRLKTANVSQDEGYATQIPPSLLNSTQDLTISEQRDLLRSEADVGIIEKISLVNFMCHSRLDFEFGPNINFVIGENGSGKSAILTALVVGLGGRANVTSRGSSLKEFIKNGQSYCAIQVYLRNRGDDGFKVGDYGPVICIERKILRTGTSSYKIKGHDNKVISQKRSELVAVLDHFNIQVDNPVSVLNQNTSRNFLGSKSPKDKYVFFLKATQLDQMKQSNAEAAEGIQLAEDTLSRKRENLPILKREVDVWERRWRILQCMKEQKDKVLELKREYAWALVNEKEQEAEKLQNVYEMQHTTYEKILHKFNNCKAYLKEKTDNRTHLNSELKGISDEIQKLQPEIGNVKRDILEVKTLVRSKEMDKRKCTNEIATAKDEEVALTKQIDEIRKTEEEDLAAIERNNRQNQLQKLESLKTEKLALKKTTNLHGTQVKNSVTQLNEEFQNIGHEVRAAENGKSTLERNLRDLEGSRSNRLRRFGCDMPNLIKQIEIANNQGKFRKKPLGPIGADISLREPKWAVGVEKCLGRLLESFCCDNHDDERLLRQLINSTIRNGNKPSIIVSPFQTELYDVKKHSVNCHPHCNVLDMLIVGDPTIGNCLIDQRNVESILLIENKSEARRILTYNVPNNCSQAFTIEGDQVFPVPSFRYYANGKKTAQYLQGSIEDKIKETQEQLKIVDSELQKHRARSKEMQKLLDTNKQELRKVDAQERNITEEISKITVKINNLMNFAEPEPVDVSSLEEEVISAKEKQVQLNQRMEELKEEISNGRGKYETLQNKHKELDCKFRDLISTTDPVKEQLEVIASDMGKLDMEKINLENKLKDQQKVANQLKQSWEKIKTEAESMKEKSENVCARKLTRRLPSIIQLEIEEIQKSLRQEEARQGTKEEVSQRYLEIKKSYNRVRSDVTLCEDILKRIIVGVKNRQDNFIKFRSELAVRFKYLFNASLNSRNFKGTIKFDHKEGTLALYVQTDGSSQQVSNDVKSLSGGERSFSTVCFIISLWEAMEAPFRILDEYDVFMDMVSRNISMDMMIQEAKHKSKYQFIFLTPLDMTKVKASGMVRICRMPNPERGVTQQENQDDEQ